MTESNSITPLKRCTKCGDMYIATTENFYKKSGNAHGLAAWCISCTLKIRKERYQKNRETIRDRAKQRYQCNREKVASYAKKRYKENPQLVKDRAKQWVKQNPEASKRITDKYRAAHIEQKRESDTRWKRANHDRVLANAARRHTRKRALPATFTSENWMRCLEWWDNKCAYCGNQRGYSQTVLAQEHFIPLIRGGGYTPDNILPACNGRGGCNPSKGSKNPHDWILSKFGKQRAEEIELRIQDYFNVVKQ